jgi:hypothetical protein
MIVLGGALALAVAPPATAQVPCVRHDRVFACADGTSLAIYEDPWRMGRGRGGAGPSGEMGFERGGDWWKDETGVHGPHGETCLLHGTHVHCGGGLTDPQ